MKAPTVWDAFGNLILQQANIQYRHHLHWFDYSVMDDYG